MLYGVSTGEAMFDVESIPMGAMLDVNLVQEELF